MGNYRPPSVVQCLTAKGWPILSITEYWESRWPLRIMDAC